MESSNLDDWEVELDLLDLDNLPTFSLKCLDVETIKISYQNEVELMVDSKRPLSVKKKVERRKTKHTCDVCDQCFKSSSALDYHTKRVHTGKKPFTCEFCSQSFIISGNLKAHRRIHTGETPYACDFCDKKFKQLSTLNSHKKVHHLN